MEFVRKEKKTESGSISKSWRTKRWWCRSVVMRFMFRKQQSRIRRMEIIFLMLEFLRKPEPSVLCWRENVLKAFMLLFLASLMQQKAKRRNMPSIIPTKKVRLRTALHNKLRFTSTLSLSLTLSLLHGWLETRHQISSILALCVSSGLLGDCHKQMKKGSAAPVETTHCFVVVVGFSWAKEKRLAWESKQRIKCHRAGGGFNQITSRWKLLREFRMELRIQLNHQERFWWEFRQHCKDWTLVVKPHPFEIWLFCKKRFWISVKFKVNSYHDNTFELHFVDIYVDNTIKFKHLWLKIWKFYYPRLSTTA